MQHLIFNTLVLLNKVNTLPQSSQGISPPCQLMGLHPAILGQREKPLARYGETCGWCRCQGLGLLSWGYLFYCVCGHPFHAVTIPSDWGQSHAVMGDYPHNLVICCFVVTKGRTLIYENPSTFTKRQMGLVVLCLVNHGANPSIGAKCGNEPGGIRETI